MLPGKLYGKYVDKTLVAIFAVPKVGNPPCFKMTILAKLQNDGTTWEGKVEHVTEKRTSATTYKLLTRKELVTVFLNLANTSMKAWLKRITNEVYLEEPCYQALTALAEE